MWKAGQRVNPRRLALAVVVLVVLVVLQFVNPGSWVMWLWVIYGAVIVVRGAWILGLRDGRVPPSRPPDEAPVADWLRARRTKQP